MFDSSERTQKKTKNRSRCVFNCINGSTILLGVVIAGSGFWGYFADMVAPDEDSEQHEVVAKFIALGIGVTSTIVLLVGWLGIFAVNNRINSFKRFHFAFISVVILPMIVLGISSIVYVKKLRTRVDKYLRGSMELYYKSEDRKILVDAVQRTFICCGMQVMPHSYANRTHLPHSCCHPNKIQVENQTDFCPLPYSYSSDCDEKITSSLENSITFAGIGLITQSMYLIIVLCVMWYSDRGSRVKNRELPL